MTAYVEKFRRRDEVTELIERHFEIIRIFLPNNQSNGTHSRAGSALAFHMHRRVLPPGLEMQSRRSVRLPLWMGMTTSFFNVIHQLATFTSTS
jgi:hypothetical protein